MAKRKNVTALRYTPEMEAPVVIAQAQGNVAEQALILAVKLGIPIQKNELLSQALVKINTGDTIPPDLYAIIAVLYQELILKSDGVIR